MPASPLQKVPASTRATLYWLGYFVGVFAQGFTIIYALVAASSPTVDMPLWTVIASAMLAFAQTQLNLLAGSNVKEPDPDYLN